MKLTLRQQITQFSHVLETQLFPILNEAQQKGMMVYMGAVE